MQVFWLWTVLYLTLALEKVSPAPFPREGGGIPDWMQAELANAVPRLGRRSQNPFGRSRSNNQFRFFGETGDDGGGGGGGGGGAARGLGSFFAPLFGRGGNAAFRYHGGPSNDLARGLFRDKRQRNIKAGKIKVSSGEDDNEYWKDLLGEATMNNIIEKLSQLEDSRKMLASIGSQLPLLSDLEEEEAARFGTPLPRFLARYHQPDNFDSGQIQNVAESGRKNLGQKSVSSKMSRYRPFIRNNF